MAAAPAPPTAAAPPRAVNEPPEPVPAQTQPVPAPAPPASDTADTGALWEAVRGLVAGSASQSSFVDLFELKSIRGQVAEVVVRDASKIVVARTRLELVSGLLSKAAGAPITARLLEAAAPSAAPDSSAVSAGARAVQVDAAARNLAMEQPLVKKAIDLFGARLIGVEDDPA